MKPLIPDSDLRVEVIRRNAGGQHVGTDRGIRVTHVPTGIVVEVDVGQSQHRNRSIALDAILGALTSPAMR